jgi:hypothetical protein
LFASSVAGRAAAHEQPLHWGTWFVSTKA